jgi:single-strand DNA-binding protein
MQNGHNTTHSTSMLSSLLMLLDTFGLVQHILSSAKALDLVYLPNVVTLGKYTAIPHTLSSNPAFTGYSAKQQGVRCLNTFILKNNWIVYFEQSTHKINRRIIKMYDKNSINKVTLIGNLGAAPEIRTTQSGTKVANIRLATNEQGKDSQGNVQERTQWHRIIAWDKLADICGQYLKTGSKVYVEGRLNYRNYEKDGQTVYVTEIIAQNIQFLDKAPSSQNPAAPAKAAPATHPNLPPVDDGNMPF